LCCLLLSEFLPMTFMILLIIQQRPKDSYKRWNEKEVTIQNFRFLVFRWHNLKKPFENKIIFNQHFFWYCFQVDRDNFIINNSNLFANLLSKFFNFQLILIRMIFGDKKSHSTLFLCNWFCVNLLLQVVLLRCWELS